MVEWYHYLIAIVGGVLAGGINTLAGNGSAITLSILTEVLGLPGNLANGTNRVGVLSQSAAGSFAFYQHGKLDLIHSRQNITWTVIGAICGVGLAIQISNEQFLFVFKYLMIAMLLVLLVKPKRWLKETSDHRKIQWWIAIPIYFALGIYGGFIQMGMGIFYLATMVLVAKYSMVEGNALKSFVVALYTLIVLAIFQYKGLVRWDIGLVLAAGQTVGGWYTAKFASRHPQANKVAYWLLIVIVILALANMFGLLTLLCWWC
ncbi:MAG: sulfite exporter TauE/SafE family protein [Saprospiraceae bacterium]|nr:sulfite exporter TauE/SafE family protein [Saprospiraceae bacterium]